MALANLLAQTISRNDDFSSPRLPASSGQAPATLSSNLNRLLSAAIVNPRFEHLLLTNPVAALATGYNGETFQLTQAEYTAVTSLSVTTLRDFAAQLLRISQEQVASETESLRDFHFSDSARDNLREQAASLPCKPEAESGYSRFASPSRRARPGVVARDGHRTTHGANTHSLKRYES
jgi:hypothetical protein